MLKEEYGAEVVAFTADLGQEYDPSEVKERAEQIGASKVIIEDLKEEFVGNYRVRSCNNLYANDTRGSYGYVSMRKNRSNSFSSIWWICFQ